MYDAADRAEWYSQPHRASPRSPQGLKDQESWEIQTPLLTESPKLPHLSPFITPFFWPQGGERPTLAICSLLYADPACAGLAELRLTTATIPARPRLPKAQHLAQCPLVSNQIATIMSLARTRAWRPLVECCRALAMLVKKAPGQIHP